MNQSKEELDYYRDDITPADGVRALPADTDDDISDDVQELLNQYLGVSEEMQDLIADYLDLKSKRRKKRSKNA